MAGRTTWRGRRSTPWLLWKNHPRPMARRVVRIHCVGGGGGSRTHVRRTRPGNLYVRSLRFSVSLDALWTKATGAPGQPRFKIQARGEARRTLRSVFASPSTVAADQRCCRDVAELGRQSQVIVGSCEVPFCRDRRLGTQPPGRIVPRRSQCAPRLAKNHTQPFQQGPRVERFPSRLDFSSNLLPALGGEVVLT